MKDKITDVEFKNLQVSIEQALGGKPPNSPIRPGANIPGSACPYCNTTLYLIEQMKDNQRGTHSGIFFAGCSNCKKRNTNHKGEECRATFGLFGNIQHRVGILEPTNKGGGRTETDDEILDSVIQQIRKWAQKQADKHANELIARIKERL